MRRVFIIFSFILLFSNISWALTNWTTGAYSNNANISNTLSIDGASLLTVTINGEMEENYDYITIYNSSGAEVGRFTGIINETITISGSSIIAVLTSDDSVIKSGVNISISSMPIDNEDIDLNHVDNTTTTWTTGTYSNNTNINHTLSIDGASSLSVTINGETEENYDYIIIYNFNGVEVGRFTGIINKTLTVSGSSIKAVLISDDSITRSGVTVSINSNQNNNNNNDNNCDPIAQLLGTCS